MNKPTFESTVNILVQAYLNDTLEPGNCMSCAVGNIIRSTGYKLRVTNTDKETYWLRVIDKMHRSGWRHVPELSRREKQIGLQQIQCTGYTSLELEKVEDAFERPSEWIDGDKEGTFSRLMAVVDVLAEIHNVDLTVKENAKLLFVKP